MKHSIGAGPARAEFDLEAGGRMASLAIDGLELLVAPDSPERSPATAWGSYPLAPWAGRIRDARFRFEGREHALPVNWPPHAIHGTTFDRAWSLDAADERSLALSIDLGSDWPFGGRAVQTASLEADHLDWRLEVRAEAEAFPASLGWHPWWRRHIGRGEEARLSFRAGAMYRRDEHDVAIAEKVSPPPGPWDDCFTDVQEPPVIEWPGALRLALTSDSDHWVVYDEPEHALCVEPMTGPPDALNIEPRRVEPGRPLALGVRLAWTRL